MFQENVIDYKTFFRCHHCQIQTQLAAELTQMHPGNKEISRSTASQTPGMLTRVDVAGKVGSWGPQGAALRAHTFLGWHSLPCWRDPTSGTNSQSLAPVCSTSLWGEHRTFILKPGILKRSHPGLNSSTAHDPLHISGWI